MFIYFITKNFFRIMMVLAAVCFAGVFVYALQIEGSNAPPEGLVLPEEIEAGKPMLQRTGIPQESPLASQHMSSNEIALKLSDIVAESLSFGKSDFAYNTSAVKKYFTETGYAQYKEFLKSASFEEALNTRPIRFAAYAEQPGLEITHGVYGDAFKWLFEVPVTISMVPVTDNEYGSAPPIAENRRILLRVQFARVNDPEDPNAVKIEIWQVLPPRRT